ncbi:integrase catalytic domain-containing protein [Vairimorpha necatrix]
MEAWRDQTAEVIIENDENGKYAGRFKRRHRETFTVGQEVRIARRENLGTRAKTDKGRFTGRGRIVAISENDSYIVRLLDGKIVKKRHYDLKEIRKSCLEDGETTRLEGGCRV